MQEKFPTAYVNLPAPRLWAVQASLPKQEKGNGRVTLERGRNLSTGVEVNKKSRR